MIYTSMEETGITTIMAITVDTGIAITGALNGTFISSKRLKSNKKLLHRPFFSSHCHYNCYHCSDSYAHPTNYQDV